MRAVLGASASLASESVRPDGRVTDQMVGSVLSEIAFVLWPTNTAPCLAAEIGCSVRAVERYLSGQREWSGDAIAAIVAEVLKRHSMRNVKVVKRA